MKRTSKLGIVLLLIILAVGFATVTTSFIINNTTSISTNPVDFDVYFSNISIYGNGRKISKGPKQIVFSCDLTNAGDYCTVKYYVYNSSLNYDASVNVQLQGNNVVGNTDYSSYYSVIYEEFDPLTIDHTSTVLAQDTVVGKITITLEKPVLEDVQLEYSLVLDATAVERTSIGQTPTRKLSGSLYSSKGNSTANIGLLVIRADDMSCSYFSSDENGHFEIDIPRASTSVGIALFTDTDEEELRAKGCTTEGLNLGVDPNAYLMALSYDNYATGPGFYWFASVNNNSNWAITFDV